MYKAEQLFDLHLLDNDLHFLDSHFVDSCFGIEIRASSERDSSRE